MVVVVGELVSWKITYVDKRRQRNWYLVVGNGKQDYFVLAVDLAVYWTWSEDSGHFWKRGRDGNFDYIQAEPRDYTVIKKNTIVAKPLSEYIQYRVVVVTKYIIQKEKTLRHGPKIYKKKKLIYTYVSKYMHYISERVAYRTNVQQKPS